MMIKDGVDVPFFHINDESDSLFLEEHGLSN